LVVAEGIVVVVGGMVDPAEAVVCLELPVAVAGFAGDGQYLFEESVAGPYPPCRRWTPPRPISTYSSPVRLPIWRAMARACSK
jgi:hypothetical protein